MNRKGIILAGGRGTRLYPLTYAVSKQLLPVYDKPMIYYPLSILLLAGIRDILVITSPRDLDSYQRLLGDRQKLGIRIEYALQNEPNGIGEAFRIGRDFVGDSPVTLVLGDNIFYGQGLMAMLERASLLERGATVFGYPVTNPERYGVIEFNGERQVVSIEEKPKDSHSRTAVTGLYFYDNDVISIAESIEPSKRGELEITDINRIYLEKGLLRVESFSRGFAWFDAGTIDSLAEASSFVEVIEKRQGLKICCPEEIAWRQGFIDRDQLQAMVASPSNPYESYLNSLVSGC